MNEFKYQFVNFILLALLGSGIYWAFTTIDNGIVYDKNDIAAEQTENIKPEKEIILFDNTKAEKKEEIDKPEKESIEEIPDTTKPIVVDNTNKALVLELQKLVDAKVRLDTGSNGENVASVQKFLKVYFKNKNISVDKDFGPTTKRLVKEFQTKELNGGGGNVGPNTLSAMIKYLKNQ